MRRISTILTMLLVTISCAVSNEEIDRNGVETFRSQIVALKEKYEIPGLSVHVQKAGQSVYSEGLGFSDVERHIPSSADTQFPVASITKLYAAALLLRAVDDGKLSLDTPVSDLLTKSPLRRDITIGQLLSHTSQGSRPGTQFYYSTRFALLTRAIEAIYDAPFDQVFQTELIGTVTSNASYLLPNSEQEISEERLARLATPYQFEGERIDGFVDYGASAAAGLVATADDVARFAESVFVGETLSAKGRELLTSQPFDDAPYGHGIFVDHIYGRSVFWGYGQYDSYSSLLIVVPETSMVAVLLANNAHLADPARLIYGNLRNSEFALAVLEHFVTGTVAPEALQRDRLKATALGDSFLARFRTDSAVASEQGLNELFRRFPDTENYADLALIHNLSMLKLVARYLRDESFEKFDATYLSAAQSLLDADPENPYAHLYLAEFYDLNQKPDLARTHYQSIIDTENFTPWWYTTQAEQWLANTSQSR